MNQTTVKIRPALINPALSRLVLWLLVLVIAFWTLEQIKTTLTIFGMAFLIAYLLNSIVTWLENRYKFPRGRAILLVYLVLFATGALATAILVPMIVGQVNAMVTQLPEFSHRITALATTLQENYISRVPVQYQAQLEEALRSSESSATEMAKSMLMGMRNFILHLVSAAFLIFTSLIVSIYVILRWGGIWQSLLEILPVSYRTEIVNLARDLNKIFGGYLKAQITLASTWGALTLAVLLVHSLLIHSNPYALVIAVVAALTLPIPVLHQVIPPITAIILGLINVGQMGYAIQLAVLVYAVNLVVERVMAPRIMSEAVGVSPLFVLLAAFSGAELLGPVGALVGVPLAAMIKSVFVWFHGRFLTVDEEAEQAHMASLESEEIALKARLHTVEARLAVMEERHARRVAAARRRRADKPAQ